MGSDTMASSSREDLEAAKEHFVQTVDFPNISCKIGVRRLTLFYMGGDQIDPPRLIIVHQSSWNALNGLIFHDFVPFNI